MKIIGRERHDPKRYCHVFRNSEGLITLLAILASVINSLQIADSAFDELAVLVNKRIHATNNKLTICFNCGTSVSFDMEIVRHTELMPAVTRGRYKVYGTQTRDRVYDCRYAS